MPLALVVAGCLAVPVSPLMAQETAPAAGETGAEEALEHAADAGLHAAEDAEHDVLPQLDAPTFPSQIVWLIISFLVLYWLMKSKALPRVAEILEARQDRIANDLDKAAMFRRDAEKALEDYEAAVAQAQTEAQAKSKALHEQMAAEHAKQEQKLDKKLATRIDKAGAEIAKAREEALKEINQVALESAVLATRKLTGIEVTEHEAKDALDRVLQEAA